jgi:hypothetical protein
MNPKKMKIKKMNKKFCRPANETDPQSQVQSYYNNPRKRGVDDP